MSALAWNDPVHGYRFGIVEGSAAHVFWLKRRRWHEAYERWRAGGRVAFKVEPTLETVAHPVHR